MYFKHLTISVVFISIATAAMAGNNNDFPQQAHLPNDAHATCVANIAPWFVGGEVEKNGWVEPADSMNPIFDDFTDNTRCDFYKWGAQMFLWLTSGAGTEHVFNSTPNFYNISVADADKQRIFYSGPMQMGVRKSKTDDEMELGQAGGSDVLLSQQQSLVYYGIHANDVYALFRTSEQGSTVPEFPSTQTALNKVNKFATDYGYTIFDLNAMAMELKTSWVDISTVSNKADYIISNAVVPIFDRAPKDSSGKQQWTITGDESKILALVGMHVVGTVNGHPEMIWSTFEHVNNAPDNTYVYTTNILEGATLKDAIHSYNSSGTWNFIESNASAPATLVANAKVGSYYPSLDPGTPPACTGLNDKDATECIVNIGGADISDIDILRVSPWGNDPDESSSTANNTDLVSINVSVLSQLKAGDKRGNYVQTGGIWTAEGQIPSGGLDVSLRGSLSLANTTMETFHQFYVTGSNDPKNCFGCHSSTSTAPTGISHIFSELLPLPRN